MMGNWSRLVGKVFLDWLALPAGLRCLDVGCGNGAFTELLIERAGPVEVQGIDPSADQLAFARERHKRHIAEFREGDAIALPFANSSFDAALMALVIFYVSDPAKSVAEMTRVVRPGGIVATYAWDMIGRGSPTALMLSEIRRAGITTLRPPRADASRIDSLQRFWAEATKRPRDTRDQGRTNFRKLWRFLVDQREGGEHRAITRGYVSRGYRTTQREGACSPSGGCHRTRQLHCSSSRNKGSRTKVTGDVCLGS
jgi:SAM-dependent methyltransferase